MRVSRATLDALLRTNVLEIRFRRRTEGPSAYRRMLCTNDLSLLNSKAGRAALHYRTPTGTLAYNPASKNLICTWDIFRQDFRMVPCESVDVVSRIPTSEERNILVRFLRGKYEEKHDVFWEYFNTVLSKLSKEQKLEFLVE